MFDVRQKKREFLIAGEKMERGQFVRIRRAYVEAIEKKAAGVGKRTMIFFFHCEYGMLPWDHCGRNQSSPPEQYSLSLQEIQVARYADLTCWI